MTNGTSKATLDGNGNLGLGVTPSAWTSNRKVIDIGTVYGGLSGGLGTEITTNSYYNGAGGLLGSLVDLGLWRC